MAIHDDLLSETVMTHVGVIGLIYAAAIAVLILLVGYSRPQRLALPRRGPLHLLGGGLHRAWIRIARVVSRLLRARPPG